MVGKSYKPSKEQFLPWDGKEKPKLLEKMKKDGPPKSKKGKGKGKKSRDKNETNAFMILS